MKLNEKINYLQENYFDKWLKTMEKVQNELSKKAGVFCVCGRLATGLHEQMCGKFKKKVINETVKELNYLFKKAGAK